MWFRFAAHHPKTGEVLLIIVEEAEWGDDGRLLPHLHAQPLSDPERRFFELVHERMSATGIQIEARSTWASDT